MAQKRGFNFSLARHYDKAFAVVVLVALLISLFVLARSAADSREQKRRYEEGVNSMTPKYPKLSPQSTETYESAVRSLRRPPSVRASTNETGLFIPQRRVWCVDCMYPIPFNASKCPFCHAPQPTGGVTTNLNIDSEGKGIPDKWRVQYFNHPDARAEDRSRADDDADDDGFANLQEFNAGTNPRDPKDHPELIKLLRFKELTTRPYPFVFMSATKMPDDTLQLTFNMKSGDRTYFAKKGEEIGKTGLMYSNCVQKNERVMTAAGPVNQDQYEVSLFRLLDGKTFVLRNNEPRAVMEQEIVLLLVIGAKSTEYRVSVGGILELDGRKYKVGINLGVDDKPTSVVLEDILTGRKSPISTGSP